MAPMVHGLEAKYNGKIRFVYLDIDDSANAGAMRDFGFRYQPEFRLLDGDGNVLASWAGLVQPEQFESVFTQVVK